MHFWFTFKRDSNLMLAEKLGLLLVRDPDRSHTRIPVYRLMNEVSTGEPQRS